MLGRSHATTGALAVPVADALGVFGFHPSPGTELLDAVLFAGGALLPDLDCEHSVASEELRDEVGFLSFAFIKVIQVLSGGHRRGTHSVVGVAAFTGLDVFGARAAGWLPGNWGVYGPRMVIGVYAALLIGGALRALHLVRHMDDLLGLIAAAGMVLSAYNLSIVPWAIGAGAAVHILGDVITEEGCPILWPLSMKDYGIPLFRVGGWGEEVVRVVAVAVTLFLLVTQVESWLAAYVAHMRA